MLSGGKYNLKQRKEEEEEFDWRKKKARAKTTTTTTTTSSHCVFAAVLYFVKNFILLVDYGEENKEDIKTVIVKLC